MTVWSYYSEAIPRAFSHAYDWAVGQGLWLTILMTIATSLFAGLRLLRPGWLGRTKGANGIHNWGRSTVETSITLIGGVGVLLCLAFVWAFVQDAPEQVSLLREQLRDAQQRTAQPQ